MGSTGRTSHGAFSKMQKARACVGNANCITIMKITRPCMCDANHLPVAGGRLPDSRTKAVEKACSLAAGATMASFRVPPADPLSWEQE